MGQLPPFERSQRILQKQGAGLLFPELVLYHSVCGLQSQWPILVIVRIARHEMDNPRANPLQRILLCHWTEYSS